MKNEALNVYPFDIARLKTEELRELCRHVNKMLDAIRENSERNSVRINEIEKALNIKGSKQT